jgi:predicted membrane protein
MKMGGLFWGIILIIIGISLIVKVVFKIDFPIMKVLVAFFFIYMGIKILAGNFGFLKIKTGPNDVIFSESTFVHELNLPAEQNVVFGRGVFDFRNLRESSLPAEIHINTVFGNSEILIRKTMPVIIKVDAAFAGATLPNDNSTVLGSANYQSANFDETKPHLTIKTDAVFSSVKIKAY